MKFIMGKKIDMTQVWQGDRVVAVTRVQAGPCRVTQTKSMEKDGYEAVQIGYGEKKEKLSKRPQKGHTKAVGNFRYLREFRMAAGDLKKGDMITVNTFTPGDEIEVTGISKGKGFQGVVRRYHFKGASKSHGTKDQVRMPGSIGATGPAHVFKGTRMGGRMGAERVTTKNLEVIEIDPANNIISVKGAVPGARNGLVLIVADGDMKIEQEAAKEKPSEAAVSVSSEKNGNQESKPAEKPVTDPSQKVENEVIEAKEKVDAKKAD